MLAVHSETLVKCISAAISEELVQVPGVDLSECKVSRQLNLGVST